MGLVERLSAIWRGSSHPFLIHEGRALHFDAVSLQSPPELEAIQAGQVVALIGDFDPGSIACLLALIDRRVILVPLTVETRPEHAYFFDAAQVDWVIEGATVTRLPQPHRHDLLDSLRQRGHPGLVLFSSGTTGRPKAILHDLALFLRRFETPRPTQRTLNFLLFDHIGGINTLLHTLFNRGTVVSQRLRTPQAVLSACAEQAVEVLPTTPTFLRMMLISGSVPDQVPPTLKLITYGTERMDQPTLSELCRCLPLVDFRQTFGMSELGIVRVKSKARDSLYMRIGGEGVETRIVDNILHIRSCSRMLGYLNAPDPFDAAGWYDTKDVVQAEGDYFKVVGRVNDVINVGGLKFMASEVERAALEYAGVGLATAVGRSNPLTGQHVELSVQPVVDSPFDKPAFVQFLKARLQAHMLPRRVIVESIAVGHRYKKAGV